MPTVKPTRAAFLDRDGTILRHVHHLSSPDDVELENGAAEALRRMGDAGWKLIVITNQSVVGRGLIDLAGLDAIHARMQALLAREGAAVDAIYFSTHVPSSSDPRIVEFVDRKPGPGLILRAAADHHVTLAASWMIGDSISDVLAGINARCGGTCLLRRGVWKKEWERSFEATLVTNDLRSAIHEILGCATDRLEAMPCMPATEGVAVRGVS